MWKSHANFMTKDLLEGSDFEDFPMIISPISIIFSAIFICMLVGTMFV